MKKSIQQLVLFFMPLFLPVSKIQATFYFDAGSNQSRWSANHWNTSSEYRYNITENSSIGLKISQNPYAYFPSQQYLSIEEVTDISKTLSKIILEERNRIEQLEKIHQKQEQERLKKQAEQTAKEAEEKITAIRKEENKQIQILAADERLSISVNTAGKYKRAKEVLAQLRENIIAGVDGKKKMRMTYENKILLCEMGGEYLEQAELHVHDGDREIWLRSERRYQAIIQTLQDPIGRNFTRKIDTLQDVAGNLSHNGVDFVSFFKVCEGNYLQKELHRELASSLRSAISISTTYYPDNPYMKGTGTLIGQIAVAAKLQKNPKMAFNLSDTCYYLGKGIGQLGYYITRTLQSIGHFGLGYVQGKVEGVLFQIDFWNKMVHDPLSTFYHDVLVPIGQASLALAQAIVLFDQDEEEYLTPALRAQREAARLLVAQKFSTSFENLSAQDVGKFLGMLTSPDVFGLALGAAGKLEKSTNVITKAVIEHEQIASNLTKTCQVSTEVAQAVEPIK